MRLIVLAVGERLPEWAQAACAEYARRMPREARLEVVPVRAQRRVGLSTDKIRAAEAERLAARCPAGAWRVVLDERGRQVSTRELAGLLQGWMASGRDVAFFIGGADGLAEDLLIHADLGLALSRLTLPHALARVVLIEQLYRAMSLITGHPYHRD
ncbi:MAG: 23S rRNA (pseudouridine(1915)-N(3))-methyltransferase RlmH [Burkholderiales bacterium]|nr:23S rRNA (pseudouridine(1915)-N(3))-methyltransferase RlmH [Burkholderiales bacterium]